MIPLRARTDRVDLPAPLQRRVWLLTGAHTLTGQRHGRAYLIEPDETPPDGFELYLTHSGHLDDANGRPAIELPAPLDYLSAGDILAVSEDGKWLRVLWRHAQQAEQRPAHRAVRQLLPDVLTTPEGGQRRLAPRRRQRARPASSAPTTEQFIITGGEPTLYGDGLIELLRLCTTLIPRAGVHVLSNGRRFSDPAFAAVLGCDRQSSTDGRDPDLRG